MREGGAVALPRLESFRANSKFGQHISLEKFKPISAQMHLIFHQESSAVVEITVNVIQGHWQWLTELSDRSSMTAY